MAWRDDLGKVTIGGRTLIAASFRGAAFFVDTAERSGGRRIARHEYPLRDEPFVEDLGRKARSFPVEGYVLGSDYLAARDALISALEDEKGPGTLAHPYYGTLSVICARFQVRESSADGGLARFGIEFEQTASTPSVPTAVPAAGARLSSSADATVASIRTQLAAQKLASSPTAVADLSAVVQSAAKSVRTALAPLVSDTQGLAQLKHETDNLILDADSLVSTPLGILDGLTAALGALESPVMPPTIMALLAAFDFTPGADRPPGTTATRILEQEGYDALLAAIRGTLLIEAARRAPDASYDSYDAAILVRDGIADRLDSLLDGATDDDFTALEQLRADLIRAVPGEDRDLPRIIRHTPSSTVPSLALAHRLYGDLSREQDLVTRNAIPRPGFILGGVELEVIGA